MVDFIQALVKHSTDSHTDESFARASICSRCPEKVEKPYSLFLNSEIKEINGFVCTRCVPNCPIATKIFATEPKNMCDKWI